MSKAEQEQWLAAAAEGTPPTRLAATVARGATVTEATLRLGELACRPAERAVGDVLLEHLATPPWRSASANPFWTVWCFTLLHHVPSLETLHRWESRVADDGHLASTDLDPATAWFLGMRLRLLRRLLARDGAAPSPAGAPSPDDLAAAVSAGPSEEALVGALASWRRSRSAILADACLTLSPQVPRPAVGRAQRHERWHAIADAADPLDVPRLLACLGKSPTTSFLDRLVEWPHPDPRIAAFASEQLVDPPWGLVRPVALYVAGLLVLNPCRRAAATLEPHLAHAVHLRPLHAAVRARLPARPDDAEAYDEAVASLASRPRDEDATSHELREAIHAAPDDPTLRVVYGDHLLERGDPRGELIALQRADRPLGRDDQKRERELLERHFAEWVGLLAPVLEPPYHRRKPPTWFEGGFLYAAAVGRLGRLEDARGDDPAWSTVRELHLPEKGLPAKVYRLVEAPSLQGIRWLTGFPLARSKRLVDVLPHLETLEVHGSTEPSVDGALHAWERLAMRSGLRRLRLRHWTPRFIHDAPHPEVLAPLVDSPLADGLMWLGLHLDLGETALDPIGRQLAAWLDDVARRLPGLHGIELYAHASSRHPVVRLERHEEAGSFRRARLVVPPQFPGRDPLPILWTTLALLRPDSLDALALEVARRPRSLPRIQERARRVGVEAVEVVVRADG